MKLIDKAALVAEIERRIKERDFQMKSGCWISSTYMYEDLLEFIDTLEVKEVGAWRLQKNEDIYDTIKDWSLHSFVCLMDDGSVQKFTGIRCECADGSINTHIDAIDDSYDDVDRIIFWTETPNLE